MFDACTNNECGKCDYSECRSIGTDYEEYMWFCNKVHESIDGLMADKKPCGLAEGKIYRATYREVKFKK